MISKLITTQKCWGPLWGHASCQRKSESRRQCLFGEGGWRNGRRKNKLLFLGIIISKPHFVSFVKTSMWFWPKKTSESNRPALNHRHSSWKVPIVSHLGPNSRPGWGFELPTLLPSGFLFGAPPALSGAPPALCGASSFPDFPANLWFLGAPGRTWAISPSTRFSFP